MVQQGDIGIVHKNLKPGEQARGVAKIKRFESGALHDPITIDLGMKTRDVMALSARHGVSGLPVLEGKKVVGIITNRDLCSEEELNAPMRAKMTLSEKFVTIKEGASLEEAKHLMNKYRPERALVVGGAFELHGLITVKDIQEATEYPLASKGERGSLRVGAVVGVGPDNDLRIDLLIKAGMDVIVIDTAHGHSQGVLNRVRWIKDNYSQMQVIGDNIATGDVTRTLVDHGADDIKVGIGLDSICTTRIAAGAGVSQIFAVPNVAEALKGTGVSLIAGGGIRYPSDMAKALAAGAHTVMTGGMLAGTDESPGEAFLFQGRSYKSYCGMGSVDTTRDGVADRYFRGDNIVNVDRLVPESIEGHALYKGSALPIVHQLIGSVRSSMGYYGCTSVTGWHEKAQLIEIIAASMNESHVHDVQITKEALNYHCDWSFLGLRI